MRLSGLGCQLDQAGRRSGTGVGGGGGRDGVITYAQPRADRPGGNSPSASSGPWRMGSDL